MGKACLTRHEVQGKRLLTETVNENLDYQIFGILNLKLLNNVILNKSYYNNENIISLVIKNNLNDKTVLRFALDF